MSPSPRGSPPSRSRGCHGRGSAVAGVASVTFGGRDHGRLRGYGGSGSASASVNRGKLRKGGDNEVRKAAAASSSGCDMKAMYSLLRSMVPGITPKASRESILIETAEYIKLLEKERARLENSKRTLDQLKRTDQASFPVDCSSSSSSRIRFEASSNITSFEIAAPIGETSLSDIFHAIHQGGADIVAANVATREGRKMIAVTAIVGGEDSATAA